MIKPEYEAQIDLLLQVLPHVKAEEKFAIEGGTAINLFIQDFPRLSVDIDLIYMPLDSRNEALENIENGLLKIKRSIEAENPHIKVSPVFKDTKTDVKLNCQTAGAQIKIEANTIKRGHLFPTQVMPLKDKVVDKFGRFADINIISEGEIFSGKICAALDRQHPRDLFDVKVLLDNQGITNEIWDGFIHGLVGNKKPIVELLDPILKNQRSAYDKQFFGMTNIDYSYSELEQTRLELIEKVQSRLTQKDKDFIVSFENGEPDWSLYKHEQLKELPAVKWKLQNIQKLIKQNPDKHKSLMNNLNSFMDSLDTIKRL